MAEKTALEFVQEAFDFFQGKIPEYYKIPDAEIPRLPEDQAWTAIWYLQNLYEQLPDSIERCGACGDLYDSEREGHYSEKHAPHHFCEDCQYECPKEADDGSV